MDNLVDLMFWEIFFIALKAISAWLLATASSVLGFVLGVLFLIGIGAIVAVVWRYLSAFLKQKGKQDE